MEARTAERLGLPNVGEGADTYRLTDVFADIGTTTWDACPSRSLTEGADEITVTYEHDGDSYGDSPAVDELLKQVGSG